MAELPFFLCFLFPFEKKKTVTVSKKFHESSEEMP